MKLQILTSMVAVSALSLATTLMVGNMAKADNTKFICAKYQDYPATIAETASGKVPVIRWTADDYFDESGEDALNRCNRVSGLIENLYNDREFEQDILTDTHNQIEIVCALNHRDNSCTLLFGVQPSENADSLRDSLVEKLQSLAGDRAFTPLER
jgi:hypothetical protein